MKTRGDFAPTSSDVARERYELAGQAARSVVREATKAMGFDREEYERRVTPEVIETARDALFGSLLAVTVGTREEFEDFVDERGYEATVVGSEHVDNVAWHPAPFAETVLAATFQNEANAAVETLRRQAVGRLYRDRFA